jgi:hypothetical protein
MASNSAWKWWSVRQALGTLVTVGATWVQIVGTVTMGLPAVDHVRGERHA